MNWVEIVMLVGTLAGAGIQLGRLAVRKAGAARADSFCTCGCGEQVSKLTGVFYQGHWWRLECWKKFNQ